MTGTFAIEFVIRRRPLWRRVVRLPGVFRSAWRLTGGPRWLRLYAAWGLTALLLHVPPRQKTRG